MQSITEKPALQAQKPLAQPPKRYRCECCGEVYGQDWVRYNGLRCHADCDHALELVREVAA